MQPYFFPYIGYFQLINAVDTFVIYDDVNYRKQSWINRNYILVNDNKHLITLQLRGASSFKLINQVIVANNREKLKRTIMQAYSKAPFFKSIFPVVERAISYDNDNLASYLTYGLRLITELLNISTTLVVSSGIEKNNNLKGKEKVIEICKILNAYNYINAPGGQQLYSKEEFNRNHINLHFIKSSDIAYQQFGGEFVPNLSIIDILMFNSKGQTKRLLKEYELI